MDIMFSLPDMIALDDEGRKRLVAERLWQEVPAIVSKYKIQDFDTERFLADYENWLRGTGLLTPSLRSVG